MLARRQSMPSKRSRIRRFVLRIVLPYGLLLLALDVVLFRLRVRPVTNAVRTFNKRILNPAMMKVAGRRHWYATVIRHTGRRSGQEYATPVWAQPTSDDDCRRPHKNDLVDRRRGRSLFYRRLLPPNSAKPFYAQ